MAGTNKQAIDLSLSGDAMAPKPAIVLIEPQLGENIGAAARAMYNFGLLELRLVRPRDGWPSEKAVAAASGALPIIERVRVFDDERLAIADLHRIYATTARARELVKPVLTAEAAAADIHAAAKGGAKTGILFGGERAGLTNDQLALADALVTFPVNPAFASLNLAQAVLLMAYEWFRPASEQASLVLPMGESRPATREELHNLFDHLEQELDRAGFLFPPHKRPSMVRNIRASLERASLTEQEVRTWRGIVKSLVVGPYRKD